MTKSEKVMYLGPTIRGVARSGAVFEGGIPKKLAKLSEKKAVMKSLIVPLSEIVAAKTAINTEGTAEAIAYDKIDALSAEEINNILEGE